MKTPIAANRIALTRFRRFGVSTLFKREPEKAAITVMARTPARFMLLGGDSLGARHMWWNFVSSRKERIEQAKEDWRAGRFGVIPGDDREFIPLPDK